MEETHATPPRSPANIAARMVYRVVFGCVAVVTLLGILSLALRSEFFLEQRIDYRLEKLAKKLDGTFTYESVRPIGLTGIAVEGVSFVPNGEALQSPLSVAELIIYPDLGAMLTGRVTPSYVEIRGLEASFQLDGGASGRGHWPWLERVVDAWSSRGPRGGSGGGGGGDERDWPVVRIVEGRVELLSPEGSMPHLGLSVDDLRMVGEHDRLSLDGAIHVDGLGYALLHGDARGHDRRAGVEVELVDRPDMLPVTPGGERLREVVGPDSKLLLDGVSLHWPPAVTLKGLRLTDTHIGVPGHDTAFVNEIGARALHVRLQDGHALMRIEDLDAGVRVGWAEKLSAQIPMRLPRLDVVVDLAARRVGAGFELVDDADGTLSLKAALDLDARDLAVALQADHFKADRLLSFVPYLGPLSVSHGTLQGQASMRYPLREEFITVNTSLNVSHLQAWVPWISENELVDGDFTVDMQTTVDLREGRLTLDDGRFAVGEMVFSLSAEAQKTGVGQHVRLKAKVAGENLAAEDVLGSLPRGLAPVLEGFELAGLFSVRFDLALDTAHLDEMRFEPELDLSRVEVVAFGPKADIPRLAGDAFAVRIATAGEEHLVGPATLQWVPLRAVPHHVRASLLAAEDEAFFGHNGFDERAIRNSLAANLQAGRVVRGGSTITQQVAKNLFLSPKKTVARKLQEAFLTWQMEELLAKERILELYANLAQWGPSVYGLEGAAQYYFQKPVSDLGVREALFLAAILPNPVLFGRHYAEGYVQADRLEKMHHILSALKRKGILDEETYQYHRRRLAKAHISSSPRPALPQAEPAAHAATGDAHPIEREPAARSRPRAITPDIAGDAPQMAFLR